MKKTRRPLDPDVLDRWHQVLDQWVQETDDLNRRMNDFILSGIEYDPTCTRCNSGQGRLACSLVYAVNVRVCDFCGRIWNPDL